MDKKKIMILAVLGVLILAGLAIIIKMVAFPDKPDALQDPPETYEVDGTVFPAFPSANKVSTLKALSEEETDPNTTVTCVYNYGQVEDVVAKISAYCEGLLQEEAGFYSVEEETLKRELPELEEGPGDLRLVRPVEKEGAEEQNTVIFVRMLWDEESLKVAVGLAEPETPLKLEEEKKPATVNYAVDFVSKRKPSELGLEGESMTEYQVIALDGLVMVKNTPCLRINVYYKNPQSHSNELRGNFLFATRTHKLYKVGADGALELLDLK